MLHGRTLGIRGAGTYEGADVTALEKNLKAAVDAYLAFCKEQGKTPDKLFSGTSNVRAGVELHRRAALYAEAHPMKLNKVVKDALEKLHAQAV